jgi:ribosomal protein S27AE
MSTPTVVPPVPAPPRCPSCGSGKIMPHLEIIELAGRDGNTPRNITVSVEQKPGSWWDTKPLHVQLRASVCGDCGYALLAVTNPGRLWEAYQSFLAQQQKG